ncbi:efflux RND transporter periplasmic adaptor subunit [Mucilaginibacter pedocola]|uniref:CzcB-like barrel-sandwich hybrid domain-containing protein n=1 Tax=Mucilaginibacter pedocola TaxID=1792845 RepID=A0A1S9PMX1_9SPHI|nr:HlyD family efflux transporter periplasmic adaptor subunit [Mucilaginibacter pedocola]OOQ62303.1 hypothetical protein BC343_02560 [Mucilaginibacter pedocola]
MKNYILLLCALLALAACHSNNTTPTNEAKPKTAVQITQIGVGTISDDLVLSGTSVYLKRNLVTSSIAAFITHVYVKLGDHVRKGQRLYLLESKERKALGNDITKVDPSLKSFGLITVSAPASGIITTFDKQQTGEYVLEGTQLCTIAASNDLAFQVNVPYEYAGLVKPGKKCLITLPDNTVHKATITTPLATMNVTEQTQVLLARPDQDLFLPENLLAKVSFDRSAPGNQQVLPKSCVVSDELLKDFWVMKLVNDSTAIKVPVKIGNNNNTSIEILSPTFQKGDKILITGNYGLADTALVTVTK